MLDQETYFKPIASKTFDQADMRHELDWIAELANGEAGDRILPRELVMYVWAFSVSDSVTERAHLQLLIGHRLSQLRVVARSFDHE